MDPLNETTDIAFVPTERLYVSDGYVNSRVALCDRDGKWLQEWGQEGIGEASSNPTGWYSCPETPTSWWAGPVKIRAFNFRRVGKFNGNGPASRDAQPTGRIFCVDADAMDSVPGNSRADTIPNKPRRQLDREMEYGYSIGFSRKARGIKC